MSCLQNRILTSMKYTLLAVILMAGNFFCSEVHATPASDTITILERNTSAHWGLDCFVWIVHYPPEIASSWAEAEALRSSMNDSERERFRKNFVSELKLDTSETFLVSIYSFGARPVNISPVDENITLIASNGTRIKPVKYDSSLDYPSSGIVQGLIFFPKQGRNDYVIAFNGMGLDERIFSFAPQEVPEPPKQETKPEVVVVNLPKKQPVKKPAPKKPTPPPPPPIPQKPIPPLFVESSQDMNDFVHSLKNPKAPPVKTESAQPQPSRQLNTESSYVSRESVLRKFLQLWADNNPDGMYDMLSESSRKNISRLNFGRAVAKDTSFRNGLKSEYKIDWIGEERAKVITTNKTLVFKSVTSRTFGVTREGSSWRIVW